MTRILSFGLCRLTICAAVAVASLAAERGASGCETEPGLNIEVTTKFDPAPVRTDYSLANIAALAHQQHRDIDRALLGFYASEFGYSVELAPEGDPVCPARITATVTLRLQHRLIEIGQEVVTNSCVYPGALKHYRRLAEVDEQTVEQFSARTAEALGGAVPALRQTYAPRKEDLDAVLRDHIRAVVDGAIAPLHGARLDAQQAVNNANELSHLASSCSI
jgi:hypothetical protein